MANRTEHRHSRWRRVLPLLWWSLAACLLLMACYVVVARQLMLLVPDYRGKLEALFEDRIQSPLEIAELEGHMDGLTPQFRVRQLRLPAPEGEAPLELDEVVLNVDVIRSLIHQDLALESLHIDGVALNLVRDADGKIPLPAVFQITLFGALGVVRVGTYIAVFIRFAVNSGNDAAVCSRVDNVRIFRMDSYIGTFTTADFVPVLFVVQAA